MLEPQGVEPEKRNHIARPVFFAGFLLLIYAGIISVFAIQLGAIRERTLDDTRELASTLTQLFDDQAQRTFQSIAILSEATTREIVAGKRIPDLAAKMLALSNIPELRGLIFADAGGKVIASSMGQGDIGTDLSKDESVLALRARSGSGLHVGKLVQRRSVGASSVGGPAYFPVARAVMDENGTINGFLFALVNASYFEMQYRTIWLRQGARIYLSRYDGILLASAGSGASRDGDWSSGNPIFTRLLPNQERGSFERPLGAVGDTEIISYRVTRHWPIVIAVGFARQQALANWHSLALRGSLAVGLLLLLITIGIFILERKDLAAARQRGIPAIGSRSHERRASGIFQFRPANGVQPQIPRHLGRRRR